MKAILTLSVIAALFMFSCKLQSHEATENENIEAATQTCEVTVNGMTCTGCEQTIDNAVAKLDGVKSTISSHENGKVMVEYVPGEVDSTQIKEAINHTGYKAISVQVIH